MAFNDDNEMQFEVLSSSSCEEKVCIEKNEIDIEVEKLAEFNWILWDWFEMMCSARLSEPQPFIFILDKLQWLFRASSKQ